MPRPYNWSKTGLAHIVGSFKSAASKIVNGMNGRHGMSIWQRNYYEHVIRGEGDLNKIQEYITDNPLQWALDGENPENAGKSVGAGLSPAPSPQ
jgi:putative transposase